MANQFLVPMYISMCACRGFVVTVSGMIVNYMKSYQVTHVRLFYKYHMIFVRPKYNCTSRNQQNYVQQNVFMLQL